jgi:hypothetical protein
MKTRELFEKLQNGRMAIQMIVGESVWNTFSGDVYFHEDEEGDYYAVVVDFAPIGPGDHRLELMLCESGRALLWGKDSGNSLTREEDSYWLVADGLIIANLDEFVS